MMASNTQQLNCIIDARVSTDKQLLKGSLDDQEVICQRHAQQKNWNVLTIYSKSYSGRKEEREDFTTTITDIQKYQRDGTKVDYYLIKSIDRFTRLGSGVYEEMKHRLSVLGVELVDVYGVIQPEVNKLEHLGMEYNWSKQSPTQIAQVIEAERSKQEVHDILVRMIGAEIALTQAGYKTRAPNDGFVNRDAIIDGKKVKIQVRDPKRALYYEKMYELRSRGDMSDEDIVAYVNAMGFRSKDRVKWHKEGKQKIAVGTTKGKPLTVKQFQKVIQKPAYVGITCEKWTHYRPIWSRSERLVDVETFNKANKGKVYVRVNEDGSPHLLYDFSHSQKPVKRRSKHHPLYVFDKMILCHECNKPFLSSASRGKSGKTFPAYHCSRNHKRVSASKKVFEENTTNYLNHLKFKKGFFEALEHLITKKYMQRTAEIVSSASLMSGNVSKLKARQAQVMESFHRTSSKVILRKLEQEMEELEQRISKATDKRNEVEIQERDIKTFLKYVREIMEHPGKTLANNINPQIQRQLFNLVFDTSPTYAEILNGTPKLSLVFKLSDEFKGDEASLVNHKRITWNSILEMICKWNDVFSRIEKPVKPPKRFDSEQDNI